MGARIKRQLTVLLSSTLVLIPLIGATAAADPSITEFDVNTQYFSQPSHIAKGPDGNLWFTDLSGAPNAPDFIRKITTSGSVTDYAIPSSPSNPQDITAGPDGNLWFTERLANKIGRITPSGTITEFTIPTASSYPQDITSGPDGNLWFTESIGNKIGKVTPSGTFTEYTVPNSSSDPHPYGITAGPDGNLWFTAISANKIGKINTSGQITEYSILTTVPDNPPNNSTDPNYITAGPDGNLWFTEESANNIGKITPSGVITEYAAPTSDSFPVAITAGSDGNLWFTEAAGSNIGKVTPSGTISEYPTPTSNSHPAGITSGPDNNIWFTEAAAHQIGKVVIASAPSFPANLTATSPAQHPILNWDASSGATSYNIYRNGSLIDSVTTPNTTTYTDNLAPEGTDSYFVTAVNAGGESPHSNSVSVLVDRTAPVITYTVTPVADTNGYNTGNVKVTFTCDDSTTGGAGIASCTSPVTVDNEGIGHTVDGTATDNAGNSTTIHADASLLATAINAGGSSAGNYAADTNFTSGQTYSTTASVDTSGVTILPAPQAVYQTVRYGNSFSYTVPNLTPNASYTLRLHFNELYWGVNGGGEGSRVFNVAVNGSPALTNYDIFKTTGGANRAVVEQLPATADTSGNITVAFTTVTDNATVSGIDLFTGTLPPAPNAPTVTSARLNAGGSATGSFSADTDFSGGTPYTSTASVDTSNVTNPAPQAVYQSVRYGNSFSYSVPNLAPNTNFLVRLHFNELYWGANGNSGGNGSRVFNVAINGNQVLSNYDIYQTAGGANKAVVEDFVVPSDAHGRMNISLSAVTDNAMVSGIEVIPPSIPNRTYYTANDGTTFSRNTSPFSSGVATQSVNSDGSVGLNITSAPGYSDSGFVLYEGTLGSLPNFTTIGSGDHYGLNIWFDVNNNNEFFAWNNNVLTGLDGDTYGLTSGSTNGRVQVNGNTSLFLMSDGQNHSLASLRNGSVSGIDANTKVAVWIGTNVNSGSSSTTVKSVNGL